MTDSIFTEDDMAKASEYPVLGPAYFASRRIVEELMAKFEAEDFKPLIESFEKKFSEKLWNAVADSLLVDTESNLQGEMHRMVDDCVMALLGGEGWALERWALTDRYDGVKIRAAVAAHIPQELQDKRVADLEKEIKFLKEQRRFC